MSSPMIKRMFGLACCANVGAVAMERLRVDDEAGVLDVAGILAVARHLHYQSAGLEPPDRDDPEP